MERGRAEYSELVAYLRRGGRRPMTAIEDVLQRGSRTHGDLVADVLAGDEGPPRPGAPCRNCNEGKLVVYATRRRGTTRIQYLKCGNCGRRPAQSKVTMDEQGGQ